MTGHESWKQKWVFEDSLKQINSTASVLGVEKRLVWVCSKEIDARRNIQSIKPASSIFILYYL